MGTQSLSKISRKTKILASTAILALTGVMGVGATMSALTDSATTTVAVNAGTINLNTKTDGTASKSTVLNLGHANWYPGATSSKTITLSNTGSLPIDVTLKTTSTGGVSGLAEKLTSTIKNGTPVVSVAGKMNAAAFSAPQRIAPGGTATLTVDIVWTSDGSDNTWAGKTDAVTYTFNAVNVAP